MKHRIKTYILAFLLIFAPVTVATAPSPAMASCETGIIATLQQALSWLKTLPMVQQLQQVVTQFANSKFVQAVIDLVQRFTEFYQSFSSFLNQYVDVKIDYFKNAMRQISAAIVQIASALGSFMDAEKFMDAIENMKGLQHLGHRMARIAEGLQCIVATNVGGLGRGDEAQKQFTNAVAEQATAKGMNEQGQPGARGKAEKVKAQQQVVQTTFCDPNDNAGAMPCAAPGAQPNADLKATEMLFVPITTDIRDPNKVMAFDQLLENLCGLPPQELMTPEDFSNAPDMAKEWLGRRSSMARANLCNMAISDMVARRAPSSGAELSAPIQNIQAESGSAAHRLLDVTSPLGHDPSYNEVMHTLLKDRFRSSNYFSRAAEEPENIARENAVLRVMAAMQASDQYEMMERTLWILAADIAMQLESMDITAPKGSSSVTPP